MTDNVRIPSVSLVIELEATPRLIIDADTDEDRDSLFTWLRQVRPDLYETIYRVHHELRDRRAA